MAYPIQFFIALITTFGFCLFFNVKPQAILTSSFAGALGWLICTLAIDFGINPIFANFFAALAIATIAEIFARIQKNPASLYIIPGILPLVPGFRIYYTIQYLFQGNYNEGITQGTMAFFIALALALGIIGVSGVFKLIYPNPPMKTLEEYEKESSK